MIKKILFMFLFIIVLLTGCKKEELIIVNGNKIKIEVGDTYQLIFANKDLDGKASYETSSEIASVSNIGLIEGLEVGECVITIRIDNLLTTINVEVVADLGENLLDPYLNVDILDFYNNYEEATSYLDSYFRNKHNLMSGSIEVPNQAPSISNYQPKDGDKLIRNTSSYYADDGNSYYIVDAYGNVCDVIYRGGAYITLEEVAAYVLAFGDVPSNYVFGKTLKPTYSPWKEYLRLNHTYFSGDTSRYPYEPLLPRISGEGGDLDYYEIDLGTTGTDCDPNYLSRIYNDGLTIVRGAARICYTRYDSDGNNIIDINEKYVFYTYNHYNDFQEYLNYYGGWGEMFGNITGGGKLSSKEDYNPTPYVQTAYQNFI